MARVVGILFIALVLAAGVCYWALTKAYTYEGRVTVPLPREIGGSAPVGVAVTWRLHPAELAASSDVRLSLGPGGINEILPDKEFSLLAAEVDSETVASMLGRIVFAPDSGEASVRGPTVTLKAGLEGEFYVRPRREYRADEEQPDAGEALPFSGDVQAVLVSVGMAEDWSVSVGGKDVTFELARETRDAWRGKHGEGDHLADLVEAQVTARARALLDRIEADGESLRPQLARMADDRGRAALGDRFGRLRVTTLEVDACPAGGDDGSISIGMGARAEYADEGSESLALPDLTVRPGRCGAGAG